MEINCKNCKTTFEGNFCNNCGQSAKTHKLSFHYLWYEFQHGFFQFDRGIVYTAQQLFTRPGHSIREFIEGKRVIHVKPISLVILLATIYGILYHYFHINALMDSDEVLSTEDLGLLTKVNDWIATHFVWGTLISIPFMALGSFIVFKKQGYNYVENFILNTFVAVLLLFVNLAAFPAVIYLNNTPYMGLEETVMDIIDVGLVIWVYSQFFNKLSKLKSILLSLFSYFLYFVFLAALIALVFLILGL